MIRRLLRAAVRHLSSSSPVPRDGNCAEISHRASPDDIIQKVRDEGLTYLSSRSLTRIKITVENIISHSIEGDIVEFGIALGGSALVLADMASRDDRAFHGFDVFSMIPAPTSEKDDELSQQRYEVIAAGLSQGINGATYYGYRKDLYSEVCASFQRYGYSLDKNKISLHKGLFEETLPLYKNTPIAFAHIDCDWYDPVMYCLKNIANRIPSGGAIVLDDYHTYGGCKIATSEFLLSRTDFDFEDGENPILRKK